MRLGFALVRVDDQRDSRAKYFQAELEAVSVSLSTIRSQQLTLCHVGSDLSGAGDLSRGPSLPTILRIHIVCASLRGSGARWAGSQLLVYLSGRSAFHSHAAAAVMGQPAVLSNHGRSADLVGTETED